MCAPHWQLVEQVVEEGLGQATRQELLATAINAARLAEERDGKPGYELPNRNCLRIAAVALVRLLHYRPRLVGAGEAA